MTIADRDYRFRSELFLYSIRRSRIYSRQAKCKQVCFCQRLCLYL